MNIKSKRIVGIVLLGSLSWVLTMIKSGLPTAWGVGFWGANGHDGVWHLALSSSLSQGFSIPTFAGFKLQNYHIGFDLLLAALSKTGVNASTWYFQILPIIFSVAIGILAYKFVLIWKKSETTALWATFFVYFSGSFGWVVTLLRGQGVGGESMFWSQQAISTLINPPFALSLIILLSGLICLQKYWSTHSSSTLVITSILFGILVEIKAYIGVLALGGLFVVVIYEIVRNKSIKSPHLIILSLSSLISVFFLKFFVPISGNVFQFSFGWFLETMLSLSDRFYWPKLYSAIFNWRAGHIYIKAILGYAVAFGIFILGNFGIRIVGVLQKRRLEIFDIILGVIFLGGIAAPMLFVQEGTAWNTIQFFYYSLFVGSLYAGNAMDLVLKKIKSKNWKYLLSAAIVIVTIPTSFSTLSTVYLPQRPPAVLPFDELEALTFLKRQPQGVVFTYPYDSAKAKEAEVNPPRPLYLYDSTAYVSAFSGQHVFLEDEVNLTILGYDWKARRDQVDRFYNSYDQKFTHDFLRNNNISYIYWVKPQSAHIGDSQLGLKNIFENKSVVIYQVIQ